MFKTLIRPEDLVDMLGQDHLVIVDCRFDLSDTNAGWGDYQTAHIPGAVYAHLDDDLCGPPLTDNGRHPLPEPGAMVRLFGRLGIGNNSQVVVYDGNNGAYASRLWWMLRYMGHEAAAVLEGGWAAWLGANFPQTSGLENNPKNTFTGEPDTASLVLLDEVGDLTLLIDSRAPARYRGEIEPLDPRAGHIPGAVNFFYQQNWGDDGYYLSADELRRQFEEILAGTPPGQATFYCGSGVTACVNILALAHAGMGDTRLYVGSWSEWSRNPELPAALGDG